MSIQDTKGEDWAEMAKLYGKLTMEVASSSITKMIQLANAFVPFAQATGIHDNGCGPGAVLSRIISDYGAQIPATAALSCSDFSPAMIEQVAQKKASEVAADPASAWARVHASLLDAQDLRGVPDSSCSHVTAGWVYFMTPDPQRCLRETRRVLETGGVGVVSAWKGSQWLELMELVPTVKPGTKMPSMPAEWTSAEGIRTELEKTGFREAEACEVPVEMTFASYEALAEMLTTMMPHMVNMMKDWSEEERRTARDLVVKEAQRMAPVAPYTIRGVSLVGAGRK